MVWLVIEDRANETPRYDAMEYEAEAARILVTRLHISAVWRVVEDTREEAIASVKERLGVPGCGVVAPDACLDGTITNLADMKMELARQQIFTAMQQTGWNATKAAKLLGVDRKTVWRNLRDVKIFPVTGGMAMGE